MWAERRSSQSTPNTTPPHSRPYSPATRRPGPGPLPPRPSIHPRSSSLSLASTPNASFTHLPTTARLINGSSLRNELRNPTPDNVPDPLHVLEAIIGAPLKVKTANGETQGDGQRPAELLEDIDFGGLSLEAFVERDSGIGSTETRDVYSYTVKSIEECTSSTASDTNSGLCAYR
jgi:hypothetical protein